MSRLRSRVRGVLRRAQAVASGPRERRTARALVAAGVVDRGWLELQSGRRFADVAAAARWYVGPGRQGGASPHPLLEPEWAAPQDWRSDRVEPALRFAPGPPQAHAHPLADGPGELQGLLPTLTGPTLLHGPNGELTYEQWCEVAVGAQRVLDGHTALKKVRTSPTWDSEADASYVATWMAAPLPDGPDPLVTVVMPVRNRPGLVVAAIRSATAQSLRSFELLVVDDGSTDTTPDVVAAEAARDPRVRLLRREQAGVCAARNAAIDEARGAYLAFLDSDNEWTPDFLRVAVAAMADARADVAFAVVEEISERGRRYRTLEGGAADLQMGNFVDLNVLVCRTEVVREVGAFDPTLRRMVDYDLVWKLADRGRLTLLPFVGVRYSAHSDVADRITTTESLAWDDVVKIRRMLDWPALRSAAGARRDDLVSVVVPLRADRVAAVDTVRSVLAAADDGREAVDVGPGGGSAYDVEVVVVENASTPGTWRLLWAEVGLDPRVRLVRAPVNLHRAAASSYGLALTHGATVVIVPAGTTVTRDALDALVDPLRSGEAVASVVVGARSPVDTDADTGADAGAVVVTVLDTVAVRAAELLEAGGLDPLFTNEFEVADLVLRLDGDVATLESDGVRELRPYERPSEGQHVANLREWQRRHGDEPAPGSRVAP